MCAMSARDPYLVRVEQLRGQLFLDYDTEGRARSAYAQDNLADLMSQFVRADEARTLAVVLASGLAPEADLFKHLTLWWQQNLSEAPQPQTGAQVAELAVMYEQAKAQPALLVQTGKLLLEAAKNDLLSPGPALLSGSAANILLREPDTPKPVKDLLAAAIVLCSAELCARSPLHYRQQLLDLAMAVNRPDIDTLFGQELGSARLEDLDMMVAKIGRPEASEAAVLNPGTRFLPMIAKIYPGKLLALAQTEPGVASMFYDGLCRAKQAGEPYACDPATLSLPQLFTTLAKGEATLAAHYASLAVKALDSTDERQTLVQAFAQHSAALPHDPALTFLATLHSYLYSENDVRWTSRAGLIGRFGLLSAAEQVEYLPEVCQQALSDSLLRVAICKAYSRNTGLAPS